MMSPKPRLLFVWDAANFGGHDVSALVALEHLAAGGEWTLGLLHTNRSPRLGRELDKLSERFDNVEVLVCDAGRTVSECLDGLCRGLRTRSLRAAFQEWQPDAVVHVQGFITLGLCALSACKSLRLPMISYLPMTHRVRDLQPSATALAHDLVNRYWYSLPDEYLVTSHRMGGYLTKLHRVPDARIRVAEYGPKLPLLLSKSREEARARIGAGDEHLVGVVGRTEFFQKRQDFVIRAAARHRENLSGVTFLLVGDGPDLEAAKQLVQQLGVGDRVRFLPWQEDMRDVYPALDLLLIPSRFEGVPLVMLEAMACRIPVLATAVDGMLDLLPESRLFPVRGEREMVDKLRNLLNHPGPPVTEELANIVETRMNADAFCTSFHQALKAFLESNGLKIDVAP